MKRPVSFLARTTFALALVASLTAVVASPTSNAAGPINIPFLQWPMFGQNYFNTATGFTSINSTSAAALKPKWVFTTGGDVSARAAVVNNVAYFPDWAGYVYAVNANTGALIWKKNIATDYLGGIVNGQPVSKVVSRTSPYFDAGSNTLYLGTQTGAILLAIDAGTGALRWSYQLDSHPLAIDTSSPILFNGIIYVGVASLEEGAAANPGYPCCSFRGSVVAVSATTHTALWKTYTVPPGYTGGAVWGSTIVPDPLNNTVYATTGNNYSTPTDPAYQACIAQPGATQTSCLSPDDHFDSVLSLNMADGSIKWSQRLGSADDWNVACLFGSTGNCPTGSGPDYDFGSGANLFPTLTSSGLRFILGAGQKSGVYSAFDPSTGKLLWATQVGPGSTLGGVEWGSATDGQRIYVAISNLNGLGYPNGSSPCSTDCAGSWNALDPATGRILWHTPDPNGAVDIGPLTVANGVVYAPSMAGGATSPNMFALNASSGSILWSFAAGGSVNAGASIANNTIYWGSGYSNLPVPGFTPNNKFYAFSVGGQ